MTTTRLDLALVARGLAPSRARAQAAIAAGGVTVAGRVETRPARPVSADDALALVPAHPWVSRGGVKLDHALGRFGIDVVGRRCLDLGSSTGGFTEVLLARGAAHVVAVDVGRGQFDAGLAADPRVTLREGTDARALDAASLQPPPDLAVADVSFISVLKVLAPIVPLLAPAADLVVLVKPQFEAGRAAIGKGGIVPPDVAERVAHETAAAIGRLPGVALRDMTESPVSGGDGNREWLAWARRG